jgi:hypothetical protein
MEETDMTNFKVLFQHLPGTVTGYEEYFRHPVSVPS